MEPIVNHKLLLAYRATVAPPEQEVASRTVFASKMAVPSGQHCELCASGTTRPPAHQTQLDQGPLTPRRCHLLPSNPANEPPPKLLPSSETNHFVRTMSGIATPLGMQITVGSGTTDHPTTTARTTAHTAVRAMPTKDCGPLRNGGPLHNSRLECNALVTMSPRSALATMSSRSFYPCFIPFFPHFYPIFTPYHPSIFTPHGKNRVKPLPRFTPVLPWFYPTCEG